MVVRDAADLAACERRVPGSGDQPQEGSTAAAGDGARNNTQEDRGPRVWRQRTAARLQLAEIDLDRAEYAALRLRHSYYRVRDRQEVTGVRFGGEAYTIALYADHVVVTLDDPVRSLPVFLEEVEAFGAVSGFWVNLSKSSALDLALPGETGDELTQCYPFQWEESSVPYLGLRVARTVTETASINYRLLLWGVKADLTEWRRYPISWTGKNSGH
ncbi:hypothetical protein NDU88_001105 [Pleurodeles waltl]|uniref:Uncharacterized protein n=1 Tax=Pleurodeles waltl TaxID=8319 RepID=A0AAV7U5K8_PLEWA|nr:hypothetical protein NDU88_001105 [Pleurodeles waltl]